MILFLISLLFVVAFQVPQNPVVTSPSSYQVFQRTDTNTGSIIISGNVDNLSTINAAWNGSNQMWDDVIGDFSLQWDGLPVGQSTLSLDIVTGEMHTFYVIENVGIGDVYVIAGQSNAMGKGINYQTYVSSGLYAGMFTDLGWSQLTDPTGYQADDHALGSEWPLLASFILGEGVPVAFVPTAVGGTRIQDWQPNTANFQRMNAWIAQLPAPYARAMLWQQGEQNTAANSTNYSNYLKTIADTLYGSYGFPTFAAKLYNNPNVNNGVKMAVDSDVNVKLGADLHLLAYNDGLHYTGNMKLAQEALAWWNSLQAAGFYP